MFEADKEMGGSEMAEINDLVKSPKDMKNFLKDGDCKVFQDKHGLKDFCTIFEEIKAKECDVEELKSLAQDQAPGNAEPNDKVQPQNAESICDPEIASAIGNLDETAIRESIKNT